jgi:hypothetical protein
MNLESGSLWHPHLKRNWLNENMFEIVDSRSKVFSTSFIQLSSSFLQQEQDNKMHCGCKFIKHENAVPDLALVEMGSKNINLIPNIPGLTNNNNVNTNLNNNKAEEDQAMANIGEMLKMNNLIMNKIEKLLESSVNISNMNYNSFSSSPQQQLTNSPQFVNNMPSQYSPQQYGQIAQPITQTPNVISTNTQVIPVQQIYQDQNNFPQVPNSPMIQGMAFNQVGLTNNIQQNQRLNNNQFLNANMPIYRQIQ